MGFELVYDYEHGKRDWGSFGLPREGNVAQKPSAGEVARRDVPTCRIDEELADVRERVRATGWETCFVVTADRVALGRLGRRALANTDDASVEAAMSDGPSTIRPSVGIDALLSRMRDHDLTTLPVTTSDGRLVGLVMRDDVERLAR